MGMPTQKNQSAGNRMQALQQKMKKAHASSSVHQNKNIAGIADEEKKKQQQAQKKIDFSALRKKMGTDEDLAKRVRKEKEKKLLMLLQGALFLNSDEPRRKRWIESIPLLPDELLENLLGAVIRENLRFKKGTRDLVLELNKKNINGQK